jgi:lysophospholipase L1-like esterase
MSAKNGLTRSFRLIGCLAAVALVFSALFASVASAKKPLPENKTTYIAMGDSVSYGYSEEKFDLNFPAEPASAFSGGLVDILGEKLAKKEAKLNNLLETKNLACPGEASVGLIGNGPIAESLIANPEAHFPAGEAPCGWHNGAGFPRHVEYGTVSQLEAAVGLVTAGKEVGGAPVKDVTFQIGSNDELHKIAECSSPAYLAAHKFGSFTECLLVEAEKTLFPKIVNNLGLIVGVLRSAGYEGPIAIMGFYNPQAFQVAGSDSLQRQLNEAVEATIGAGKFGPHVVYGNPFKKTNPHNKKLSFVENEALEKAAICKYTEECNEFDKHQNLIEALIKSGKTKAEAEALATPEATAAYPAGDIHPSPEGHKLFAKTLYSALKKA